jgi:hypothetical protein
MSRPMNAGTTRHEQQSERRKQRHLLQLYPCCQRVNSVPRRLAVSDLKSAANLRLWAASAGGGSRRPRSQDEDEDRGRGRLERRARVGNAFWLASSGSFIVVSPCPCMACRRPVPDLQIPNGGAAGDVSRGPQERCHRRRAACQCDLRGHLGLLLLPLRITLDLADVLEQPLLPLIRGV